MGTKQDRVLDTTVLVGAGASIVPVSCVERHVVARLMAFPPPPADQDPGKSRDRSRIY